MTLSKQGFYGALARVLRGDDWLRMPGPTGMSALFAKRSEELILSLGFFESDLYEEKVTAELALAGHTSLIMMGFPGLSHARCRVGEYLLEGDREVLLDERYRHPGVVDAWWSGRTEDTVVKMAKAIRLAGPRFVARPGLREEITRNERHRLHIERLRAIAMVPLVEAQPAKVPPDEWVDAANALLTEAHPKHRRAAATRLAADAWRTYRILGMPTG